MTKNRMFTQPTADEWESTYKEKAEIYDNNATKLESPQGEEEALTGKKLLEKARKERKNESQENPGEPDKKSLKISGKHPT